MQLRRPSPIVGSIPHQHLSSTRFWQGPKIIQSQAVFAGGACFYSLSTLRTLPTQPQPSACPQVFKRGAAHSTDHQATTAAAILSLCRHWLRRAFLVSGQMLEYRPPPEPLFQRERLSQHVVRTAPLCRDDQTRVAVASVWLLAGAPAPGFPAPRKAGSNQIESINYRGGSSTTFGVSPG